MVILPISVPVLINDNLTEQFPQNSTLLGMSNRDSLGTVLEEAYHLLECPCHALTCGLNNILK